MSDTTEPGDLIPARATELSVPARIVDRNYREELEFPTPVSGDLIAKLRAEGKIPS